MGALKKKCVVPLGTGSHALHARKLRHGDLGFYGFAMQGRVEWFGVKALGSKSWQPPGVGFGIRTVGRGLA